MCGAVPGGLTWPPHFQLPPGTHLEMHDVELSKWEGEGSELVTGGEGGWWGWRRDTPGWAVRVGWAGSLTCCCVAYRLVYLVIERVD